MDEEDGELQIMDTDDQEELLQLDVWDEELDDAQKIAYQVRIAVIFSSLCSTSIKLMYFCDCRRSKGSMKSSSCCIKGCRRNGLVSEMQLSIGCGKNQE